MAAPFESLTTGGQRRRLRRVAARAVDALGLAPLALTPLAYGENATFRGDGAAGRFLVRVHSDDYHRPDEIRSELAWLRALATDTDMSVPPPVADPIVVEVAGVSPRPVTVFRWMEGRKLGAAVTVDRARALGGLLAALHRHASAWTPPTSFTRRRWDAETLFRWWPDSIHDEVVGGLTSRQRRRFDRVEQRFRAITRELGEGPEVFGLIHGDLHPGNCLIRGPELAPIDFDDCRFGWRLYDLAVPWRSLGRGRDPAALRAALLEGYRRDGTLPTAHEAWLPDFERARLVTIALFLLWRGRRHPGLREDARQAIPLIEAALG